MTKDIIAMARRAGAHDDGNEVRFVELRYLERFAALVAAAEREKVATWMIERSYATGHGDTTEDLLKEMEWQVRESEREACAKVCEAIATKTYGMTKLREYGECAVAIRAKGAK